MALEAAKRAIAGAVAAYQGSYLEVGIVGKAAEQPKTLHDGSVSVKVTLGEVAHWLHFGTSTIPARPFIDIAFRRDRAAIRMIISRAARAVASGRMTERQALSTIGEYLAGVIKEEIANRMPPPNAPSTIARKKSDVPLIDEGQLIGSISYEIVSIA